MPHTQPPKTEVLDFTRTIVNNLDGDLLKVILYGSVAHGNASVDSDIDILLVVRDQALFKTKQLTQRLSTQRAYDTDYGSRLSPRVLSESGYTNATQPRPTSFMRRVLATGIILYDQAKETT